MAGLNGTFFGTARFCGVGHGLRPQLPPVYSHSATTSKYSSIELPGVNTIRHALFPTHERKSAIKEPPRIETAPQSDPQIHPNATVIDPGISIPEEVFLMSGEEGSGNGAKTDPFQALMHKYGGELCLTGETSKRTSLINMRIARQDRHILNDLSTSHGVNVTTLMRLAYALIMDATHLRESMQQYGGDVIRSGKKELALNFRLPPAECTKLKRVAQENNLSLTIISILAIRLLKERLDRDSSVRSAARPPHHVSFVEEFVYERLDEKIAHAQITDDGTVIIVTESGAVYVMEIKLRKITTEK